MKTYDLAVIDANYLSWRSFYAHPNLSVRLDDRRVLVGMAYGFLQAIVSLVKHYDVKRIVVAWDSEKFSRRKMLHKSYKANRKKDPNLIAAWQEQRAIVVELLNEMPITQITIDGEEADDVIASVVYQEPGMKLIVGSDHDLFQLLSKKVHMLILRKNIEFIYSVKRFKKEYGFRPKDYWQVMSLTGDRGDNVPGIPRFGEKTAIKFLKKFPDTVADICQKAGPPTISEECAAELEKRCGSFEKACETIKLARRLTKLQRGLQLTEAWETAADGDWQGFLEVLGRYEFRSMMAGERRKMLRALFEKRIRSQNVRSA